jgi:hypothetical protein
MDSFNFCKEKFDELKLVMQHAITWVEQRSDYLSRIISQKVGTLYSLPQFYEAPKVIKSNGTLKQVYNAQSVYFSKQVAITQ